MTTTLTNRNGDPEGWGTPTIPIALDPFSTSLERATGPAEPSDWLKVFLTAPTGSRPTLTAYAGYEPPAGRHAYYWDDKTMWWRDTITDEAWIPPGDHIITGDLS